MRDSRLEQSQMYYKNVLAKKITEDVNFVPAYEEAMEKIEAKIPHVIQLISHDHRAFKIVQDCALDLASAILKNSSLSALLFNMFLFTPKKNGLVPILIVQQCN